MIFLSNDYIRLNFKFKRNKSSYDISKSTKHLKKELADCTSLSLQFFFFQHLGLNMRILLIFKALVGYMIRKGLKLFFLTKVKLLLFYLRLRLVRNKIFLFLVLIKKLNFLEVGFRFNFWRRQRKSLYMPFLISKKIEILNGIRNFYKFAFLKSFYRTAFLEKIYLVFYEFFVSESLRLNELMENIIFENLRDKLGYLKNSRRFRISYRNIYNNYYNY